MDENKEELSFVPSVVSDSPGCHKARFMCYKRCKRERRLQVPHRSDNGGGRRRAAHTKLLHGLLEFEARGKERTSGERQAM